MRRIFPPRLTKNRKFRELLEKCAATAMSSKLIHSHETFFVKMVVDAVLTLDQNELDEKLIGIKKIPGGAMQVSPVSSTRLMTRTRCQSRELLSRKVFHMLGLNSNRNRSRIPRFCV